MDENKTRDFWIIANGVSPSSIEAFFKKVGVKGLRPLVLSASLLAKAEAQTPWSDGDVVLLMGREAFQMLLPPGVPKTASMTTLRQTSTVWNGAKVFFTFAPGAIGVDPEYANLFRWDLNRAMRWFHRGSDSARLGEYKLVPDLTEFIQEVKALHEKSKAPVAVAWDLETMGLFPEYPSKKIVCSSWCHTPGTAVVCYHLGAPDLSKVLHQVHWLLNTDIVKSWAANGKFDARWMLKKHNLIVTNSTFDITLAASLVNENRSNSLNNLVKVYDEDLGGYDDEFNKTIDKSRMELVEPETMLPYSAGDADGTMRVGLKVLDEIKNDSRLVRFYKTILHPAAAAFVRVEDRGILVDKAHFAGVREKVVASIAADEAKILELLGPRIRAKFADDLNIGRADVLISYFFTPMGLNLKPLEFTDKKGLPSTSIKHLQKFAANDAAAAMVSCLRSRAGAHKTLTTYIDGFLSHLRPDGRFHPSYMLHHGDYGDSGEAGTVTGRTSAKDPAIQTLPKKTVWAKHLRKAFKAPPGYVMFEADYKQGELKIAACLANEANMLEAYASNGDLHTLTASGLAGKSLDSFKAMKKTHPDDYARIRGYAKAVNFGFLYGMGAEGFQTYALDSYGLALTLGQCEEYRRNFLEVLYPGLPVWHDRLRHRIKTDGLIRSPLGRVRHLPMAKSGNRELVARAERQGVNAPVQSTLSDLTLWAVSELEAGSASTGIEIAAMIHDAIVGYYPEDRPESWRLIRDTMETLPITEVFGWEHQIPFTVEVSTGPDLASLVEME